MHADHTGALWVATDRELLKVVDGHSSVVPLPEPPDQVTAIASDRKGGLWIADRARGVFRWPRGALTAVPVPPSLSGVEVLCSLAVRNGDVWFAFADGSVGTARDHSALR